MSVTDIFAKPSELQGGSSAWIFSGVSVESKDKAKLYTADYTYYAKKGEKILDIQRSNSYSVSVRVFATENFLHSLQLYEKLANVKVKSKKQIAPVSFGERGVMLVLPDSNNKSNQANFYLTFLMRSFVVQVYADDGFALMDMAGFVEQRLAKYTMQNAKSYFINKINLIVSIDGVEVGSDIVTFTGDNITKVKITGKLFDKANNPIANAEIISKQTGQKTRTNINGEYQLDVVAGKGREITLNKAIFLPISTDYSNKLPSGLYSIKTKYKNNKVVEELLELSTKKDQIEGKLFYDNNSKFYKISGSFDANDIVFMKDCSQDNSTFACKQKFAATINNKSTIDGLWKGSGGGGSWTLDKGRYAKQSVEHYPHDIGVKLIQAKIESGKLVEIDSDKLSISNADGRSFIYFMVPQNLIEDQLFFSKGEIILTKFGAKGKKNKLVLYDFVRSEKGVDIKKIATLAEINLKGIDEAISLQISSQLRQPNTSGYLIGVEGDNSSEYHFDEPSAKITLTHYKDMQNLAQKKEIMAKIISFKGIDIVGNSNSIKGDDAEDIEIDAEFNFIGKTLDYIEIVSNGKQVRRWNTNPYDIYPAVAVTLNGNVMNEDNGAISLKLDKDNSKVKLYIYKGSVDKNASYSMKVMLDGKLYESDILFVKFD